MEAGFGQQLEMAQAQLSTSAFRITRKKEHMPESAEYNALIAIVDDHPSVRRGSEKDSRFAVVTGGDEVLA
jgi:hypothetical protein